MIRRMILNDLEQVVAIDQASFSLPWPPRSFQFELTDNTASRCWVVEVDNKIVAMLVGWFIIDELHVATIATQPACRKQGFGKKILTYAMKSAKAEGARRVFLEVRESNQAAINMYVNFGFVEDGRRKEYYKDNNEDAILMTLYDLSNL
jgi:[ribosomal protein S18]-alanine N-acetyltransferase